MPMMPENCCFRSYFVLALLLINSLLRRLTSAALSGRAEKYRFWTRPAIQVFTALVLVVGLASAWFDDPTRLATALGLVTAGLAFALQRVVTAIAGYVVILRGQTFSVGDRIVMGASGVMSSP
jgi:small-conductance mechanosensitive channel